MRKGSGFSERRSSLGLGFVLPLLAIPVTAQDPPAELVWSKTLANETYSDHAVAIGNHGTQVFCDTGALSRYTRLYGCTVGPDPLLLWEESTSTDAYRHRVDAAEDLGIYVASRQEPASGGTQEIHVEAYESASSSPRWSYVFPEGVWGADLGRCAITPDGAWIVAGMKGASGLRVVVFETYSNGTPAREFSLPFSGGLDIFEISDDASRLHVANGAYAYVYDLNSGAQIFYKILFSAKPWGHAYSADGGTLVYLKGTEYHVLRDQGYGDFQEIATFEPFAPGSTDLAYIAALSGDGNTLVATGYEGNSLLTAHLLAWDVPSGATLLSDTTQGAGIYQNLPSDLAITPDASRIAFGLWGDEAGLAPEIVVFERTAPTGTYERLASFDRPGSVHELDLSADGKELATSGRDAHMNQPVGEKVVEMFDLGSDLRVSGRPTSEAPPYSPGPGIDFTYYLTSGAQAAFLVEAGSLADSPRTFSLGTLQITRPTKRIPMVVSGGVATLDYHIDFAPGVTRYYQGYSLWPATLSEDWVEVTALLP